MNPKALMITGALVGVIATTASFVASVPAASVVVAVWAAGALFGKGYGVWEERQRKDWKE